MVIITYGCHTCSDESPVLSHEHKELGLFTLTEVDSLPMPDGYRRSTQSWFTYLTGRSGA